jgi:hypothetical protein
MEVEYRLSRAFPIVDYHPVSALLKPFDSRDFRGFYKKVPQDGVVFSIGLGQCREILFGDNQDMNRRYRVDIPESQAEIVFINNISRNVPVNYFRKDCHDPNPAQSVGTL